MDLSFYVVRSRTPAPRSIALSADSRHGVEQHVHRHTVVDVGRRLRKGERDAAAVSNKATFSPPPVSTRRVWGCLHRLFCGDGGAVSAGSAPVDPIRVLRTV
jgi:hypothetical protein